MFMVDMTHTKRHCMLDPETGLYWGGDVNGRSFSKTPTYWANKRYPLELYEKYIEATTKRVNDCKVKTMILKTDLIQYTPHEEETICPENQPYFLVRGFFAKFFRAKSGENRSYAIDAFTSKAWRKKELADLAFIVMIWKDGDEIQSQIPDAWYFNTRFGKTVIGLTEGKRADILIIRSSGLKAVIADLTEFWESFEAEYPGMRDRLRAELSE